MFPYHDENETQRTPIVTILLIALSVGVWLLVQGGGSALPLAESVCNLGLIPGELPASVAPGTAFKMGDGPRGVFTDPGPTRSPNRP